VSILQLDIFFTIKSPGFETLAAGIKASMTFQRHTFVASHFQPQPLKKSFEIKAF